MGRRSSKAGSGAGAAPGFDTVGVTILPGHPLPEWVDGGSAGTGPADVGEADATGWSAALLDHVSTQPQASAPQDDRTEAAAALATLAASAAGEPGAAGAGPEPALVGAAAAAAAPAAGQHVAHSAEPGYQGGFGSPGPAANGLGGYGAPAYGAPGHGAPPYGVPAYGAPGHGAPWPGATSPAAGVASPGAGLPAASGAARASGYAGAGTHSAHAGMPTQAGYPTQAATQPGIPTQAGMPMAGLGTTTPAHPQPSIVAHAGATPSGSTVPSGPVMGHEHPGSPNSSAGGSVPSAAGAGTGEPSSMAGGATATATMPPPALPAMPSAGWTSPDRPELSPEHVALLTWWADMIAKGQFPPPGSTTPLQPEAPRRGSRRMGRATRDASPGMQPPAADGPAIEAPTGPSRPAPSRRRTVLVSLGLGGIALAGLAVAFGPMALDAFGDQPATVAAPGLTMPATVGDLVAITGDQVGAQLQPLLGFGLRPAGVTVTGAYGTDPAGPLVLAAMATTVATPGDAAAQTAAWVQRTGATVGEPVVGSGATQGISCVEVTAIPAAPTGSMCVWSGTGMRGQTYVVATSPDAALQRTAELRAPMEAPTS